MTERMLSDGAAIYAEAREWIGTPVIWEASLKPSELTRGGCDCRGLIAGAAREVGRPEAGEFEARVTGYAGRIDGEALRAGLDRLLDSVPEGEPARRGDVLLMRIGRTVQHLALHDGGAPGEARMLHAYMSEPALVCEVPIDRFWSKRIVGIWRWKCQFPS